MAVSSMSSRERWFCPVPGRVHAHLRDAVVLASGFRSAAHRSAALVFVSLEAAAPVELDRRRVYLPLAHAVLLKITTVGDSRAQYLPDDHADDRNP